MFAIFRRFPAASYFALAIGVSWGGILAIVLPTRFPANTQDAERLFVLVYLAMLAGPAIGGVAMAATSGRQAMREYGERLVAWRAQARWYAIALLTAPIGISLTLFALSLVSSDFVPSFISGDTSTAGILRVGGTAQFVLTGLAIGAGAGLFEELGWSGFAVPRLLERFGVRQTGLIVGFVWGGWHLLAIYWGSASAVGTVPAPLYLLVALFSFLVPYRILMTWVYRNTRSTFVGVLMHASLTSSMLVLGAPVSGWDLVTYDLVLGGMFWIVVASLPRSLQGSPDKSRTGTRSNVPQPA